MLRARLPFKLFPLSSIRSMAGSESCDPSRAVDVHDMPNQSQCDPPDESQLVDVVQDIPSVQVYREVRTSRSVVVGETLLLPPHFVGFVGQQQLCATPGRRLLQWPGPRQTLIGGERRSGSISPLFQLPMCEILR